MLESLTAYLLWRDDTAAKVLRKRSLSDFAPVVYSVVASGRQTLKQSQPILSASVVAGKMLGCGYNFGDLLDRAEVKQRFCGVGVVKCALQRWQLRGCKVS